MRKGELIKAILNGGKVVNRFYTTHTSMQIERYPDPPISITQRQLEGLVRDGLIEFDYVDRRGIIKHYYKLKY